MFFKSVGDPLVGKVKLILVCPLFSEADIQLILAERSANDPKRTLVSGHRFAIQLLYLGHLNTDKAKPA